MQRVNSHTHTHSLSHSVKRNKTTHTSYSHHLISHTVFFFLTAIQGEKQYAHLFLQHRIPAMIFFFFFFLRSFIIHRYELKDCGLIVKVIKTNVLKTQQ